MPYNYEQCINKFTKDPKSDIGANDSGILITLFEEYLRTHNIAILKQITNLSDTCLNDRLKGDPINNPDLLEDLKNNPLSKTYPLMQHMVELASKTLQDAEKEAMDHYQSLHAAFPNWLSQEIKGRINNVWISDYLKPGIFTLYDVHQENTKEQLLQMTTEQRLNWYIEKARQYDPKKALELENLAKPYVRSLEKWRIASGLNAMVSALYDKGNTYEGIVDRPDISYQMVRPNIHILNPHVSLEEVAPNPLLLKLNALRFQNRNKRDPYQLMSFLCGISQTLNDPQFAGWTVAQKTSGADQGFILSSPQGNKVYVKATKMVYSDYLCAQALSNLGIKMAESSILYDDMRTPFLATLDLTRGYHKENVAKKKLFYPLESLVIAPKIAYNYETHSPMSLADQQIEMNQFLDNTLGPKGSKDPSDIKARRSYAKLMLISFAFGMGDLTGHGGNVGVSFVQRAGKETYLKFSVIDYTFYPIDITDTDIHDLIKRGAHIGSPVFRQMYARLTEDDFRSAAAELAMPKERAYNPKGILQVRSPKAHIKPDQAIKIACDKTIQEISRGLSEQDIIDRAPFFKNLEAKAQLMSKNLQHLVTQLDSNPELKPTLKGRERP